jgi:UDP-glucose 4-epimerase
VNEVAALIGTILDRQVIRQSAPPRPGDIRDSWADVTAAADVLGWQPTVSLDDGLRLTAHALLG